MTVALDTRLTANFMLSEFAVSEKHPELAREIEFSFDEADKLYVLCHTILQPIRDAWGPVTVNSGKRTPDLNAAIAGSMNSQHLYSEAADIVTPENNMGEVHRWVVGALPDAFGQCILYFNDLMWPVFVHVSIPSRRIQSPDRVLYKYRGAFHEMPPLQVA